MTFVQRFGSALQLNIHFHVVAPDGVFVRADDGVCFRRLPAPVDEDVELLLRRCASRVVRMLRREVEEDELGGDALAALEAASLSSRPRTGEAPRPKRLTAFLEGFSLHAGVHIHENDRRGLEQLCRYGARGAIALSRLTELPDGRIAYHMKRPLPDGRTHLVLTGVELLRKLAPLVPPPRFHLLRFHGVFAPNAKLRPLVVPRPPAQVEGLTLPARRRVRPSPSPYRLDWAAALKRVFGVDVVECGRCGGRLTVLAFIEELSAVRAILDHLGLPSAPLPLGKARDPPQTAWDL